MPEVVALSSFEHNGKRRRGDQFAVSDAHALALSRAGLVMLAEESAPTKGHWFTAHVVCIASGPSLTRADVERVREWRQEAGAPTKRRVIVVNTSYKIAPWADALYGNGRGLVGSLRAGRK